jgi:oligoendopeptidase F
MMPTTIESTSEVRWDLGVLYSDITDPQLDSDLRELAARSKHFSATYKGNLAESLGAAIKDYAELEMLEGKVGSYVFLRESTDLADEAIKAKRADFQREMSSSSLSTKAIPSSPSIVRGSSISECSSRIF